MAGSNPRSRISSVRPEHRRQTLAGFQPIAHGGLITVVDLDVFQIRRLVWR